MAYRRVNVGHVNRTRLSREDKHVMRAEHRAGLVCHLLRYEDTFSRLESQTVFASLPLHQYVWRVDSGGAPQRGHAASY
jgi:hypothetical protein